MARSNTKPNSGAAVLDKYANGDDFETQAAWMETRQIQRDSRVRLKRLSHVRYQHPDLDEIDAFLNGTLSWDESSRRATYLLEHNRLRYGSH